MLEANYQFEEQKKKLLLEEEEKDIVHQETLQKQMDTKVVFILLTLFLLILIAVIYQKYLVKKKATLEVQKEMATMIEKSKERPSVISNTTVKDTKVQKWLQKIETIIAT